MKPFKLKILCFLIIFAFARVPQALADLTINLIAVNASETEKKEIAVKYYLPAELEPEDIVDAGGLALDYDVDRSSYFVHKDVVFNPKQSKTFKVKVKDVWFIDGEEIEILKNQLDENVRLLELEEHPDVISAQRARDRMHAQLDFVLTQQTSYSENIDRRIEEYRAYVNILEEIRSNVYSLDFLEHESKALEDLQSDKTVKFVVEVQNPSESEEKTVQHKHYLPAEVRAEHVVEKQGFDVRFDHDKDRAFLAKEEVFQPSEVKRYEFEIQDIWHMSLVKIDALETRAQEAQAELIGTIYEASANFLVTKIMDAIEKVRESQGTEQSIKQHIGIFRVNENRYNEAKEDVERLEEMLAIVRAKKLSELESGKVKNVLQRLQALRGLAALSEALFKKGISVTVTWRIIFGTIIFVAFFTALHFFIWSKRSKTMGEELSPEEGESIKTVPKPGEGGEEEEDEEEG